MSTRARNILTQAGFDLTDLDGTRRKLHAALLTGMRWRNCGRKTVRELERWVAEPAVVNPEMNEALIERGAVSFLESKGYTIIPPNKA